MREGAERAAHGGIHLHTRIIILFSKQAGMFEQMHACIVVQCYGVNTEANSIVFVNEFVCSRASTMRDKPRDNSLLLFNFHGPCLKMCFYVYTVQWIYVPMY